MTNNEAKQYLTNRYYDLCARFPRTYAIPVSVYVARNLAACMFRHNYPNESIE